MKQPCIPFEEPQNPHASFTNPFTGISDTDEIVNIIANIIRTVQNSPIASMENTVRSLKCNIQDLLISNQDPAIVRAAQNALQIFKNRGLD
jgi:hypothetical protein